MSAGLSQIRLVAARQNTGEGNMAFPSANENFEGVVRKLLLGMPYLQWLGLSFVDIAPGEVDFSMPLRSEITFDGKSVQAGPRQSPSISVETEADGAP